MAIRGQQASCRTGRQQLLTVLLLLGQVVPRSKVVGLWLLHRGRVLVVQQYSRRPSGELAARRRRGGRSTAVDQKRFQYHKRSASIISSPSLGSCSRASGQRTSRPADVDPRTGRTDNIRYALLHGLISLLFRYQLV